MNDKALFAATDRQPALIPVTVSAHHVHLSSASIVRLFGPHHVLHPRNDVRQPDQFASAETVSLIGPKGRLDHVRVLGPARDHDQVEVSRTDALHLGIDPPLRESGDLARTPGIRIQGPVGVIDLPNGVICALRHLHASPADAAVLGLRDRDRVEISLEAGERPLIFGNVRVRVSPTFRLEFHIDTDEANAAGISGPDIALFKGRISRDRR